MSENYTVSIQDVISVNKRYVSTNGKENGLFSPFEKIFNSKASGKNISTQLFCKCTNPGSQDQIRSQCILFSEHLLLTFYDVSRFNSFNIYGIKI